jgi:hypothetical protein
MEGEITALRHLYVPLGTPGLTDTTSPTDCYGSAPGSLAAPYRVAVSFRAAPLAAPAIVRSTTAGVGNKKAVKSDPGERTILSEGYPKNGVGIRLNGSIATALTPSNVDTLSVTWGCVNTPKKNRYFSWLPGATQDYCNHACTSFEASLPAHRLRSQHGWTLIRQVSASQDGLTFPLVLPWCPCVLERCPGRAIYH